MDGEQQTTLYQDFNVDKWAVVDGVLTGADTYVAAWVSEKLGDDIPLVPFIAFGILASELESNPSPDPKEVRLKVGAYFFNERKDDGYSNIEVAVASDGVPHHKSINRLLQVVFRDMGHRRITAHIDLSNTKAVEAVLKLGFQQEGALRNMAPDGGSVGVFGLLPSDCPFYDAELPQ